MEEKINWAITMKIGDEVRSFTTSTSSLDEAIKDCMGYIGVDPKNVISIGAQAFNDPSQIALYNFDPETALDIVGGFEFKFKDSYKL